MSQNSWVLARTRRRESLWICVLMLMLALGCGHGEIKGTYDVELQVLGASRPLNGTLILSTMPLDIPTLAEDDEAIDPNWFGGDALSANSCFILSPHSTPQDSASARPDATREPGVVRVFEVRIKPDGVEVPIEILHASDLRIEITKLQFFANTLGGELTIHTEDGIRTGRIQGARVAAASSMHCVDALAAFRKLLLGLTKEEGNS